MSPRLVLPSFGSPCAGTVIVQLHLSRLRRILLETLQQSIEGSLTSDVPFEFASWHCRSKVCLNSMVVTKNAQDSQINSSGKEFDGPGTVAIAEHAVPSPGGGPPGGSCWVRGVLGGIDPAIHRSAWISRIRLLLHGRTLHGLRLREGFVFLCRRGVP